MHARTQIEDHVLAVHQVGDLLAVDIHQGIAKADDHVTGTLTADIHGDEPLSGSV